MKQPGKREPIIKISLNNPFLTPTPAIPFDIALLISKKLEAHLSARRDYLFAIKVLYKKLNFDSLKAAKAALVPKSILIGYKEVLNALKDLNQQEKIAGVLCFATKGVSVDQGMLLNECLRKNTCKRISFCIFPFEEFSQQRLNIAGLLNLHHLNAAAVVQPHTTQYSEIINQRIEFIKTSQSSTNTESEENKVKIEKELRETGKSLDKKLKLFTETWVNLATTVSARKQYPIGTGVKDRNNFTVMREMINIVRTNPPSVAVMTKKLESKTNK